MKGAEPKGTAKDPAASGGVLPYTAAMVISSNEAHGPVEVPSNSTAAVAEENELSAISLQKRVNVRLGLLALYQSLTELRESLVNFTSPPPSKFPPTAQQ